MSSHEKGLVSSIEQAIQFTRTGSSPNEAISKVASEAQYGPEMIRRMVEGYNKSKSVDYLTKTAATERAKPFPLASFYDIMKSVYTPPVEKTASEFKLPERDFSSIDIGNTWTEKIAGISESVETRPNRYVHPASVENAMIKHAHVVEGIKQEMHNKVALYKYKFEESLQQVVDTVATFTDSGLQKFANNVINGYPESGKAFVQVVAAKLRRTVGRMDKTANYVIFPIKEPYLTVTRMYEYAEKMAKAELEQKAFEKSAGLPTKFIAGDMLADSLMRGIGGKKEEEVKKPESGINELDPKFYNDLRGLEAQRMFTNLALYDPDLQKYDINDLSNAFNTASHMGLTENEAVLKNVMLSNLQSGGLKDTFEMKGELDIAKALRGGEDRRV